jgi:hypothetical protein
MAGPTAEDLEAKRLFIDAYFEEREKKIAFLLELYEGGDQRRELAVALDPVAYPTYPPPGGQHAVGHGGQVGAAASNSLASQSRSIRSHSPRGFRQLTDGPRPANVTNPGGDPNETQDHEPLRGAAIIMKAPPGPVRMPGKAKPKGHVARKQATQVGHQVQVPAHRRSGPSGYEEP